MHQKYSLDVAAVTDKGKKKLRNEDSILANTGENGGDRFGIFVVADGVGGSDGGQEASMIAVEQVNEWWDHHLSALLSHGKGIDDIATDLKLEAELINLKILETGRVSEKSMASTFTALIVVNDQGRILHIGDSRIYRIRKNEITLLTEDHTWVSDQVSKGMMSESEALKHKNRHAITRCLGIKESCEIDLSRTDVKDGDLFLACSDGFYNYYHGQDLLQRFRDNRKSGRNQKELLCNMVGDIYSQGAHDNISAILVSVRNERKGLMRWLK